METSWVRIATLEFDYGLGWCWCWVVVGVGWDRRKIVPSLDQPTGPSVAKFKKIKVGKSNNSMFNENSTQ